MTKGLIVAAGVAASCVWLAVGLGGTAAGGTESNIEPQGAARDRGWTPSLFRHSACAIGGRPDRCLPDQKARTLGAGMSTGR